MNFHQSLEATDWSSHQLQRSFHAPTRKSAQRGISHLLRMWIPYSMRTGLHPPTHKFDHHHHPPSTCTLWSDRYPDRGRACRLFFLISVSVRYFVKARVPGPSFLLTDNSSPTPHTPQPTPTGDSPFPSSQKKRLKTKQSALFLLYSVDGERFPHTTRPDRVRHDAMGFVRSRALAPVCL